MAPARPKQVVNASQNTFTSSESMQPYPDATEIDDDWRSVIRDACDLGDLYSHQTGLSGCRYSVLGSLTFRAASYRTSGPSSSADYSEDE